MSIAGNINNIKEIDAQETDNIKKHYWVSMSIDKVRKIRYNYHRMLFCERNYLRKGEGAWAKSRQEAG